MRNSLFFSYLSVFVCLGLGLGDQVRGATSTSSVPMGFYRLDLEVGYQTVGISVVNPALFASWVGSSASSSVTATDTSVDVGALLDPAKAYYVEIVEGPTGTDDVYVGQRFEVDVATTIDAATGGGVTALAMDSERTTWVNDPPADPTTAPALSGYRFELRAHITLGQVFDPSSLHGSGSFADADQVQVFDGSGFSIYYVLSVGDFIQWTQQGDQLYSSQANLPIAPGQGLIFKRSGSSSGLVSLRVQGMARVTPFVQPLEAGFNFVSEGYPVSNTPTGRGAFPNDFGNGDQVQLFDGAGFVTYELLTVADRWVQVSDTTYASQNLTSLFDYRSAVFVNLSNPTTSYRIDPPPYAPAAP